MFGIRFVALAFAPLVLLIAFQTSIQSFWQSFVSSHPSSIAVVFTSTPHFSHVEKVVPFAEGLARLGYSVHFITGRDFEGTVNKSLVKFEPLDGAPGMVSDEVFQKFLSMPPEEGGIYLANEVFMGRIPDFERTIQRLFGRLNELGTTIVHIHEQSAMGFLPQQLGKEGILPATSMSLGIVPICLDSNDTYPFKSLKLPDTSADRKAIHHKANLDNHLTPESVAFDKALTDVLAELGVTRPHPGFFNSLGALDDYILQIGLPEFEYERSDLVPKLVFLGAPEQTGGERSLPSWWGDIAAAKEAGKSIVVVSQGSSFPDLQAVLVPALKALKNRDDLLVIGTTVVAEPEDVPGLEVPPNARIAKFVPFDLLLPEASLLICAGGYGTVIQAIAAGVPMVHTGVVNDKAHIGLLAEHKGISVDLKTGTPTPEQLVTAVNTILGDNAAQKPDLTYLDNIQNMSKAIRKYQSIKIMEETILAALKGANRQS